MWITPRQLHVLLHNAALEHGPNRLYLVLDHEAVWWQENQRPDVQKGKRVLDIFNHVLPRPVFDRFKAIAPQNPGLGAFEKLTSLWDMDARFRLMDGFPGYRQIICLSNPPIEMLGAADATPELARFANDHMAELCHRFPDRFPGFIASMPMNNPDASIREAERAIMTLRAVGVQVFTNVLGRPLSHPDYFPLFQAMRGHDLPIWIHPMRGPDFADYASESASEHEIYFTFGWPYETSACVTRLIFSGLFDKLPGIKIVTHHYCGMVPFFAEKVALGFSQIFDGTPTHNPAGQKAGLKLEPIEYYRMLHADTAVNGSAAAAKCGHAFFGSAHSLFATDAPFDPVGGANLIARAIDAVNQLDITQAERARIFEGNARQLLKMPSPIS